MFASSALGTEFKGNVFEGITEELVVSDEFVPRRNLVQLSYVGGKFREYFYGQTFSPCSGYSFTGYKFIYSVDDNKVVLDIEKNKKKIIATSIPLVWSLLLNQPYKELPGLLTCNGKPNVFHIPDINEIIRPVVIFWRDTFWDKEMKHLVEQGWNIRAYSQEQIAGRSWYPGGMVFARNS